MVRELRRWLLTEGEMGECPDYYPVIKASRYLGVPAWELEKQPTCWTEWALACEAAEIGAQNEAMKNATKQGR